MDLLPEDVLADILRRLAPRWLATSRCVCRAWRAAVDNRGLLSAVAGLLPRSLAGIFIHHSDDWVTCFLRRPSAGPIVSADLDYTFSGDGDNKVEYSFEVSDHCNGLVLLQGRVVNPATRQWARLPPRPPPPCTGPEYFYVEEYLAYDPTVSPHYEVFSIPRVRRRREPDPRYKLDEQITWDESPITYKKLDPALEELEWPPSPCVIHVFSSRTGTWQERSFLREGAAAGTVAQMRIDTFIGHRYAVYWRGALYVQCQTDFIMRLSLSSEKYQLIQPPVAFVEPCRSFDENYARRLSIGKSEKGVYTVLVDQSRIKVCYQLESHGPWLLQPITSHYYTDPEEFVEAAPEQFEWDSDNDDLLPDNGNRTGYKTFITFIGFHPYKEVIFLNDSLVRVLAYHLNSSKIQDLGYVYPEDELYDLDNRVVCVDASFPYTPCWMRDFPQND
ncbi:unnamed protein product [Urochloa decumbens]|uniref:F-box domain-containing protein n=1 Tax=Urochloa decumbens TaxID=240449 RepID=A0ABC8YI90_9POAL